MFPRRFPALCLYLVLLSLSKLINSTINQHYDRSNICNCLRGVGTVTGGRESNDCILMLEHPVRKCLRNGGSESRAEALPITTSQQQHIKKLKEAI